MQTIETKMGNIVIVSSKRGDIDIEHKGKFYQFDNWKDIKRYNQLTTELLKRKREICRK